MHRATLLATLTEEIAVHDKDLQRAAILINQEKGYAAGFKASSSWISKFKNEKIYVLFCIRTAPFRHGLDRCPTLYLTTPVNNGKGRVCLNNSFLCEFLRRRLISFADLLPLLLQRFVALIILG